MSLLNLFRSNLVSILIITVMSFVFATTISAQCEGIYFKTTSRTIADTQTYINEFVAGNKARDMNGDGKIDLVATNVNSTVNFNKLFIYPGNGAGGFGTRTEINLPGALYDNSSYFPEDFNSDGKTDIVVQYSTNALVYLNNGTGAFSPLTVTALGSDERVRRLADINGDSRLDLITFTQINFGSNYRFGNADGTFGAPVSSPQIYPFPNEGDFDGDGDLDFAVQGPIGTNNTLRIYFNQGGAFVPSGTLTTFDGNGYGLTAVADFNNDNKPDLLFSTAFGSYKTAVLINQGNNAFAKTTYALPSSIPSNFPHIGDFDGDGDTDFINYRADAAGYVVNTNNGAGAFTQREYPLALHGVSVIGDLNGDGKTDFIRFNNNNRGFGLNAAGVFNETTFFTKMSVCNNPGQPKIVDFDRDAKTNRTLWRAGDGQWRYDFMGAVNRTFVWGANGDQPVPGDYDGDSVTDYAVFRPDGVWSIRNSSNDSTTTIAFGFGNDKPVPADYNGDGKTDIAVFRPSNGTWYFLTSGSNQFSAAQFGIAEDIPLPEDYDGDGKADTAVFRPSQGNWYILRSSNGSFAGITWGLSTDTPHPADYDGDGKADICVRRASTGYWYILRSYNNQSGAFLYGFASDVPQIGDYDGNGIMDLGVYRPDTRYWYSTGGVAGQFGEAGESPAASILR